MITLCCRPSDTLEWAIPETGTLFFRFDLGLEDPFFLLDDEMQFESLSLALKKFRDEVWPKVQERTTGAVLYKGNADFSSTFWKNDQRFESPHAARISCADAFAYYFQMLSHSLPDELPIYLFLDATNIGTIAERHLLLSRTRFEHFQVATRGLPYTNYWIWKDNDTIEKAEKIPDALCLPEECPIEILVEKIDQIQKPFRVISEAYLTEDWEGVDRLYVLKDFLSEQGKRKLKGFLATGGEIIY